MEINKNDKLTVDIVDYTSDGLGLGKADGRAIFVRGGVIGDRLDVIIIKVAKNYCVGKAVKLLKPSKNRIQPDCPAFEKCGGCAFRNIPYKNELEYKQKRVEDCIWRIGGIENADFENIFTNNVTDRYRNKAQFKLEKSQDGKVKIGFYAPKSHRVIECRGCPLHPEEFERVADIFCRFVEKNNISIYDEQTGKGLIRQLYLRRGAKSGELAVCVVINGNRLFNCDELVESLKSDLPDLKSVVININREKTNVLLGKENITVFGKDTVNDSMCGLDFCLSPHSFYQVNSQTAEKLFEKAGEFAGLSGKETVVDLYCGAGAIGLSMAKSAHRVIGVEIVPQAVENAKQNAKNNRIKNCEFICADASCAAKELANRKIQPEIVVVDPPRKGCDEELLNTVAFDFAPQKIVYVSCDPATLARDVKLLTQRGYTLQKVAPFDMFPRTVHVETLALLLRVGKKDNAMYKKVNACNPK